jgi:hypothetical protein
MALLGFLEGPDRAAVRALPRAGTTIALVYKFSRITVARERGGAICQDIRHSAERTRQ